MAKQHHISDADVARLGPSLAAVKAKTDPKRWRSIVKYAHARGFTVGGALSGAPDPLKERLQSSLASEARRTVDQAYTPAAKELDTEGARVAAIGQRRRADEDAFNRWAAGEREKLLAQAQQADSLVQQRSAGLVDAVRAGYGQAQTGLRQQAGQQTARVSDPNQSNALDISREANRGVAKIASEALDTQQTGSLQTGKLAAVAANALAAARAQDALREAASQEQQGKVTAAKSDLAANRAKAFTDLLTELRKGQSQNAQASAELDVAADKLGVDRAKVAFQQTQAAQELDLKKQKINLDKWIATHRNSVEQAKISLGYDKIKSDHGEKEADRQLKKWLKSQDNRQKALDRAAGVSEGGGRKQTAAEKKAGRDAAKQVETVLGEIDRLHGKRTPGSNIRKHLRDQGADDITIDVAEDKRTHGGKLSPRGRRKAKALGISDRLMRQLGWI